MFGVHVASFKRFHFSQRFGVDSLYAQGVDPGTKFAVGVPKPQLQLEQLKAMGFTDEEKCLEALRQANGNVEGAVNVLC